MCILIDWLFKPRKAGRYREVVNSGGGLSMERSEDGHPSMTEGQRSKSGGVESWVELGRIC